MRKVSRFEVKSDSLVSALSITFTITAPFGVASTSLTASFGSLKIRAITSGAAPRSGSGASAVMNSVGFGSMPAALATLSKSAAAFSFVAASAAFSLAISTALILTTASRTRSFTSSSFGM